MIGFDSTVFDQAEWENALSAHIPGISLVDIQAGGEVDKLEYLLVWKPRRLDWSSAHCLKAVIALGAGLDGLQGKLILPPDVPLLRLHDAGMPAAMNHYLLYAVLHYVRDFDFYWHQESRAEWAPQPLKPLNEWTVGILGQGSLGSAAAGFLQRMGFKVQAWSKRPRRDSSVKTYAGEAQLNQFLRNSQILISLLPLTPETHHLLNTRRLAELPRGAALVNVSRGSIVEEGALIHSIQSGHLRGATLDVFAEEPLPPNHPFWKHPAIRITPHVAAPTQVTLAAQEVAELVK